MKKFISILCAAMLSVSCLTACGGNGKGNLEASNVQEGTKSPKDLEADQNAVGTEYKYVTETTVTETTTEAPETTTVTEETEPVETDENGKPKQGGKTGGKGGGGKQPTAPPVSVQLGEFSVDKQQFTVSPTDRSNLRDFVELTNLKPQNGIREIFYEGYGDYGFMFKGDIFTDEDTRWQEFTFDNVAIFTLQRGIAVGDMDGGGGIVYSAIGSGEYTIGGVMVAYDFESEFGLNNRKVVFSQGIILGMTRAEVEMRLGEGEESKMYPNFDDTYRYYYDDNNNMLMFHYRQQGNNSNPSETLVDRIVLMSQDAIQSIAP